MAPARCHPSADTQCPCYCAQFARGRPNCRSPRALEQLTAKCTWNYWNHPVDRPGARSRASSRHPRLVPPPGRPLRAMPVPEAETAPVGPADRRPAAWPPSPICARTPPRPYSRARSSEAEHTLPQTPSRDPARRCRCYAPFPPAAAAAYRQLGHFCASVPNGHAGGVAPTNSCPEAPDLSHSKGVGR